MNERYFSKASAGLTVVSSGGKQARSVRAGRMRRNLIWRSAGLLGVLAGCAAGPVEPADSATAEYRRDDARILAAERYEARRRRCEASGGAMHVSRDTSGRLPPLESELRLATCRSRLGPLD